MTLTPTLGLASTSVIVQFGEIAVPQRTLLAADVPRPKRFVGLEHIVPGSLRILRWMDSKDVAGPGAAFETAHVLFGRLRPNLRKSAIAEWNGICSPEILVLAPSSADIDPGFLALVTQSSEFRTWAIRHATGSKMPRASWQSLARFPLKLPTTQDQLRLWQLADAFDEAILASELEAKALRTARVAATEALLAEHLRI